MRANREVPAPVPQRRLRSPRARSAPSKGGQRIDQDVCSQGTIGPSPLLVLSVGAHIRNGLPKPGKQVVRTGPPLHLVPVRLAHPLHFCTRRADLPDNSSGLPPLLVVNQAAGTVLCRRSHGTTANRNRTPARSASDKSDSKLARSARTVSRSEIASRVLPQLAAERTNRLHAIRRTWNHWAGGNPANSSSSKNSAASDGS